MKDPSIPLQRPVVPDTLQPDVHWPDVPVPPEEDEQILTPSASTNSPVVCLPISTERLYVKHRPDIQRKKTDEAFRSADSMRATRRAEGKEHVPLQVVYLGIAITTNKENENEFAIGITAHDSTYSINYERYLYERIRDTDLEVPEDINVDLSVLDDGTIELTEAQSATEPVKQRASLIEFVLCKIHEYRKTNHYKIVGGAITEEAHSICPQLRSLLWAHLDIVCFKFKPFGNDHGQDPTPEDAYDIKVDEESDSVARKAIEQFGPNNLPRLMVKFRNEVGVDVNNQTELATLEEYRNTVSENTWKATMHYVESLKKNKTRIAFFNSTPQGGGVALMRHALIRFLRLAGVDCKWYVPRPNHDVFRITKNNHNILQGVDQDPKNRLTAKEIDALDGWCSANASRYWTPKTRGGGPLAPIANGGAHVIIIDDPQLPKLAEIAKEQEPTRPVIYRSHIQVRADLTDEPGSMASEVWNWIWERIHKCDVFVSHPVRSFVPKIVTPEKVGYMPATTDWLDGLGKTMSPFDLQYYMHEFYLETRRVSLDGPLKFHLQYADLHRPYIVQIARFDPAKGIPTVLAAYAHFRRFYAPTWSLRRPQLIIAGHGAIDDPDAEIIYQQTVEEIKENYAEFESDIIVMRLGPSDQILNTLMQNATVALQLSTREGFEVKVSEALKHGKPVIATRTGGIPLQIQRDRTGFLVRPGDYKKVAKYLDVLFRDTKLYEDMSLNAANSCSDEVSTVGNALCWLYLADTLARGETVRPNSAWVNDMARDGAGVPFDSKVENTRIMRSDELDLVKGATGEAEVAVEAQAGVGAKDE